MKGNARGFHRMVFLLRISSHGTAENEVGIHRSSPPLKTHNANTSRRRTERENRPCSGGDANVDAQKIKVPKEKVLIFPIDIQSSISSIRIWTLTSTCAPLRLRRPSWAIRSGSCCGSLSGRTASGGGGARGYGRGCGFGRGGRGSGNETG